ncbi:HD domain-containing protein [Paraburkholderia sediminicola]|uniref:HD domain-containing protein n=1 Tax=Paraburkholderia sediminicola TaxID=458836 RepID=UPI0038B868C4
MSNKNLEGKLEFLREAEKLKDVLRTAHTSSGRNESTAEHSWRLCLMAITFEDELGDLDFVRVLKMCVIHDLGEALHGDIPAIEQLAISNKSEQERRDLVTLAHTLDESTRDNILSLWDEYESAASPEARAVKALDKLETLLQHNQGKNPENFDYEFNLGYGRKYTDATALFKALREMLDDETRRNMQKNPAA